MYLVKSLSRDKGKGQIHHVSAPFALQIPWGEKGRYIVYLPFSLVPREGLYQIHGHRSGGAQNMTKGSQNPGLVSRFSATPRGQLLRGGN